MKQKNKLLDHKIDNKTLTKVGKYFKIACFINNLFGKRFQSDEDLSDEILERLKSRKNVANTLVDEAEQKGCAKR